MNMINCLSSNHIWLVHIVSHTFANSFILGPLVDIQTYNVILCIRYIYIYIYVYLYIQHTYNIILYRTYSWTEHEHAKSYSMLRDILMH